MKLYVNPHGYAQVNLRQLSKSRSMKVHRLVMLAFKGDSELFVNHKNGIKTDNRLENLEYVTAKENTQHAISSGLMKPMRSEDVHTAKLTQEQVKEIRAIDDMTQKQIARLYSVDQSTISRVRKKDTWT